jgi:hypothetical protein
MLWLHMGKIEIDFMIIGHPFSGTGYMAKLFTNFGYPVGHEVIGIYGISCWTFAVEKFNCLRGVPKIGEKSIYGLCRNDFAYKYLIHCVRNPFDVANSLYNKRKEPFYSGFIRKHISPPIETSEEIDSTILSVIRWNKMIADLSPSLTVRVEDCVDSVYDFLLAKGYGPTLLCDTPTNYNSKKGEGFVPIDFKNIMPGHKARVEMEEHCHKYGYTNILNEL